jgi:DNA polymerase-3 subunit delta
MPVLSEGDKMIITLTGENDFGWQHELSKLAETFTQQHGDLALERLDGEEAEFGQLREAATSLPFLADKKLVILRQPSKNKQFTEQAEQIFDDLPDTNDIILIEPKLDKRLSYYKFLKKQTDFREFPELDQHELSRWLSTAAKDRGGSLSPADARYLVERIGTNQQLLSNELEKLLLYSSAVDKSTIDLLTDPTPQSTIFQLLEAAFAGNGKKTLQLYAEQRALKVEPAQIIAMLAWQLHVLAIIKTAGGKPPDTIAKEAKLNPFVVRKSQGIARQVNLSELRLLIKRLLKIDVAIKSTDTDADEALQNYLLALGR